MQGFEISSAPEPVLFLKQRQVFHKLPVNMVALVDVGIQRLPSLHIAYYITALYGLLLLISPEHRDS
jgi:hypothetical protein